MKFRWIFCLICTLFSASTLNTGKTKIYFVAETGFSVAIRQKRGKSLKSTPTYLRYPIRTRNILVCAITNKHNLKN